MEVVGTCPVLYVVVRVQRGDDEMQASLDVANVWTVEQEPMETVEFGVVNAW